MRTTVLENYRKGIFSKNKTKTKNPNVKEALRLENAKQQGIVGTAGDDVRMGVGSESEGLCMSCRGVYS